MNSIRTHLHSWLIARGRQARQQIQRISEQAAAKARQAGRVVAARVQRVQRAAGLPDKLIRRSVQLVAGREPSRPSDAAWQRGYLQVAVPATARRPAEKAAPVAVGGQAREDERYGQKTAEDREAGQ